MPDKDSPANIPLVDLHAQYQDIRAEIDQAVAMTIERSAYIGGASVRDFERDFAAFCGVEHAVGVGNGTDALELALEALGIGAGDEVLVPSMTFAATGEGVARVGARPVLVDVDRGTLNIDVAAAQAAVTARTRAIIPVHLYGQPADMDAVADLAAAHELQVVEDCAQAHGAEWRGQRVGGLGAVATFSFYPGKNLGAYGDGGCVVTRDATLAERVRMLADHGRSGKYEHELIGRNSRLDGLQAAILAVKLRHLERWSARRREIAALYTEQLDGVAEAVAQDARGRSVYHLFVVRVRDRDRVQQELQARGIAAGIHYPVPLHRQPAFAQFVARDAAQPWVADEAAASILSLPMFPELTDDAVVRVARSLREVLELVSGEVLT